MKPFRFSGRRRGEREVKRRDALSLPAGYGPDRFSLVVSRVVEREEYILARFFGPDKIKNPVVARGFSRSSSDTHAGGVKGFGVENNLLRTPSA